MFCCVILRLIVLLCFVVRLTCYIVGLGLVLMCVLVFNCCLCVGLTFIVTAGSLLFAGVLGVLRVVAVLFGVWVGC